MSSGFGERLKQRRLELRMTQTDVARESGLTPAAISQFESNSGGRKPSATSLHKLSNVLKCSVAHLLGKKELDIDDLLADSRIAEMLEGMLNFSEDQKRLLLTLYEFLKYCAK